MSAGVLRRTGLGRPGPRLRAVVASEVRVWSSSPLRRSLVAAGGVGVLTSLLLLSTGQAGWSSFLAYQNLWVVAVGPAFTAVLAGWVAGVGASCGRGGTLARGVAPWRRRLALVTVVWTWSVLGHAAVLGATLVFFALAGTGETSLASAGLDAARLVAVLAVSSVGYVAVLVVVGEVAGLLGCCAVGVVSSVTGVLTAESAHWWASPPAWQVRPALPLIGTHANGVALGGQALPGAGAAVALSAGLAVTALVVVRVAEACTVEAWRPGAAATYRSARRGARPPAAPGGALRGGDGGAVVMVVRRSAVPPLAILAVLGTLALLRWREPGEVASFWALLVMPLGAALVPVLWVPRLREGLRAVATRRPAPVRWGRRLLGLMVAVVSGCSVVVVGGLAVAGMGPVTALGFGAMLCLVGCLLVCLSTWLVTVVGVLGCLLATSCGVVLGLLVFSSQALGAVGFLVPWSWAAFLDDEHLAVTVPAALVGTVLLGTLAAWGVVRTGRA
ncbi:hypothetical protein [Pseudokineococcus sp. 1T1Z-3]|uniref:hypothetical protein n=1 Tax=Pseudokineococcus sp. 1T1Z-3 TaxID=3132745 RepID=UPI0030A44154